MLTIELITKLCKVRDGRKQEKFVSGGEERKELLRSEKENRRNCKSGGEEGGGCWPRGCVSDITLMNQCQRSDEKIIKKQARSVLNTAKGKRPILLYWNSVRMEKNSNTWEGGGKSGAGEKKKSIS